MDSNMNEDGYNKYNTYETNILNIIENEKKQYIYDVQKYNNNKGFTTDIKYIYIKIKNSLEMTYMDFVNGAFDNMFVKDRWAGIGYLLVVLSCIYFIFTNL